MEDFIINVFREDGHWLAITGVDVSNKSAIVGCGATPKDALKELLSNMGTCEHDFIIGEVKEDHICDKYGIYASELPDDYPR